eukprot:3191997-Amphidinium_carterae.1
MPTPRFFGSSRVIHAQDKSYQTDTTHSKMPLALWAISRIDCDSSRKMAFANLEEKKVRLKDN